MRGTSTPLATKPNVSGYNDITDTVDLNLVGARVRACCLRAKVIAQSSMLVSEKSQPIRRSSRSRLRQAVFAIDAKLGHITGLCSGGVGSHVRPFARPPDRQETWENQRKTTKVIGKLPTSAETMGKLPKSPSPVRPSLRAGHITSVRGYARPTLPPRSSGASRPPETPMIARQR